MSTAVQLHTETPAGLQVRSDGMGFRDRMKFAEMLVTTGFLPASVKTPAQALAIIETGRELGIPPMHALRSIAVIQGKPTLSAELQLALFKGKGGKSKWVETTAEKATVWLKHPNGDEHTETFTIEDAKRAELTGKDGYKKYAKAMLRARAISAGLRAVAPDIVAGLYDPEELGADVGPTGEIVVPSGTVAEEGPSEKQVAFFEKLLRSHVWTDEERDAYSQRAFGLAQSEFSALLDEIIAEGKTRKAKEGRRERVAVCSGHPSCDPAKGLHADQVCELGLAGE